MRTTRGARLIFLGLALALVGAGPDDAQLVDAAKRTDRAAVQALLKAGANVNVRSGDGSTALLWAAYKDDLAIADLLIKAKADVNAANDVGATPIWAAARNGSAAMTKRLLDAGANPSASLLLGEQPIVTAARSGNPEVVELLLAKGSDPNVKGPRGQTPLLFAAAEGHVEVVNVLIKHKADVNARSDAWQQVEAQEPHGHPAVQRAFDHGGNTPLMLAARNGDVEVATALVAAGADVNAPSAWGFTPLSVAAYSDFYPVRAENGAFLFEDPVVTGRARPGQYQQFVRLLLDHGADPNGGGERFTALIVALLHHHQETVDLLLVKGADANLPLKDWTPIVRGSPTDFYIDMAWVGASPLWLAARYGTPATVRALLQHGADAKFVHHGVYYAGNGDLAQKAEESGTALHAATRTVGNKGGAWANTNETTEAEVLEVVQQLVDAGVDVNARDSGGHTAVEGANELGFQSVVDYLVSKGAPRPAPIDPNARRGRRPR